MACGSAHPSLEVLRPSAPPLPPRGRSREPEPPSHSTEDEGRGSPSSDQWRSQDPRSSSTHSIAPPESGRRGRRTLLLIYIHGFSGNEMSFQSFPAHVHNLLSILVSKTHAVHTKIYPRYKSRKAIEFARDDFSAWLEPNETPATDVVLLGHSMGGILAAEIALLPLHSSSNSRPFRHRIIGTVGFDCPYLGMHPGVVVSGISSMFRPAPQPPVSTRVPPAGPSASSSASLSPSPSQASVSTVSEQVGSLSSLQSISPQLSPVQSSTSLSTIPPNDPYFNPSFPNDIYRPQRKGLNSVLHFINKHSDQLTIATKQYFLSHLEFGGCLADYPGLKRRYAKLRALEDGNDLSIQGKVLSSRIRFVNYWTASTGILKEPKIPPDSTIDSGGHLKSVEVDIETENLGDSSSRSSTPIPRISIDEYNNEGSKKDEIEELVESRARSKMQGPGNASEVKGNRPDDSLEIQYLDPVPIGKSNDERATVPPSLAGGVQLAALSEPCQSVPSAPDFPAIPPMPEEPQPIDLDVYTDKESRKVAERKQKSAMKAYKRAVADRKNAVRERHRLIEMHEKKAKHDRDKQIKAEKKTCLQQNRGAEERRPMESSAPREGKTPPMRPKRDKKFCMLPSNVAGKMDRCWVRVFMEGVDEVGAHCGLFFPGPHYEGLVGDVGDRIEEWIKEDASRRTTLDDRGN